jgi:hypothetical protein
MNTVLVEVYRTPDDPAEHKETAHYQAWRDTLAEMMAEPRSSVKVTAQALLVRHSEWPALSVVEGNRGISTRNGKCDSDKRFLDSLRSLGMTELSSNASSTPTSSLTTRGGVRTGWVGRK